MHANNEIGTIQPIEEIGKLCKDNDVYFHTDACQSFGKIPLDFQSVNLDLITLNAHKIYGPKGVGALVIRKGTKIAPLLHGGGQERGWRSSTENIPGIVGFVMAAQLALSQMDIEEAKIRKMRDQLEKNIINNIDGAYINGHPHLRLYNNINFSIQGMEGETMRLLLLLDEEGIAVSAGSACSSNDKSSASHVLQAIGRNQFEARGSIRISLGRFNTEEDVNFFSDRLINSIKVLNPIFS
jgi:cysteine desulfurase